MNSKNKKRNSLVINIENITINLNMTEPGVKPDENVKENIADVLNQILQKAKNQP